MIFQIISKLVFLTGILSSPLPYLLTIFSYLLAFSFGLFSKTERISTEEEPMSNISNYEKLISVTHTVNKEYCHFAEYFCKMDDSNQFVEISTEKEAIKRETKISLPQYYHTAYSSYTIFFHSNRPPPAYS